MYLKSDGSFWRLLLFVLLLLLLLLLWQLFYRRLLIFLFLHSVYVHGIEYV